jgi:hypothetical protein
VLQLSPIMFYRPSQPDGVPYIQAHLKPDEPWLFQVECLIDLLQCMHRKRGCTAQFGCEHTASQLFLVDIFRGSSKQGGSQNHPWTN